MGGRKVGRMGEKRKGIGVERREKEEREGKEREGGK